MDEVRDIPRKGAVDELIAEVLEITGTVQASSVRSVVQGSPSWGLAKFADKRLDKLRDIAIAAQQERVEGQEGAEGCAALGGRPKSPDEAGNRPSVDSKARVLR